MAEHVVWTGWLPMREGWRYVRAAQVGLSPVPRGFLLDGASPTKVPEYLAQGVPVVCNDNPDQQAIVEASGAGRCVRYTAEIFAKAVSELLVLSESVRSRIIETGRAYLIHSRSYARVAKAVANAYFSAAN